MIKNAEKTEILDAINNDVTAFINHGMQSANKYGVYASYNNMIFLDKIASKDIQEIAQYVFKNHPAISIETNQKIIDKIKNSPIGK